MPATPNILVLDVGTTGVKGVVFDEKLRVIGRSYFKLRKSVRGAKVEQDPRELVGTSTRALRAAVRKAGVRSVSLAGLSITTQRETFVLWDSETGRTVHPAIVWEDKRTAARCRALKRHAREVRQKTGLALDPYFSASKAEWVLRRVPQTKELARAGRLRFGTVDTWLMWNLLEGRPHRTDYTNASRTLLFNIRALRWDAALCSLFGVPLSALPEALPSIGRFGFLRRDVLGRRIPVVAVCGDQQASLFAAGRRKGSTKATYGTGAFVGQVAGPRFAAKPPFFTTLAAYPQRPYYVFEAKVEDCGRKVQQALGDAAAMRRVVTQIARSVAAYLKKLPRPAGSVVLDGGVTQYQEIVQIQSQAAGMPARSQRIYDGTALGAAMLGRLALRSFSSVARRSPQPGKRS